MYTGQKKAVKLKPIRAKKRSSNCFSAGHTILRNSHYLTSCACLFLSFCVFF